jgi:hypothetical protein
MAQTATIISAFEKLEGEYVTVLTLVFYSCDPPMLQLTKALGRPQILNAIPDR